MAGITAEDDEREQELESIASIWPELIRDAHPHSYNFCLDLPVSPKDPLQLSFPTNPEVVEHANLKNAINTGLAPATCTFSHLPPLKLSVNLPEGYPDHVPPIVSISTTPDWLPTHLKCEMESGLTTLWEDYQSQILFAYIDSIQENIDSGFSGPNGLEVSSDLRIELLDFQARAQKSQFDSQTFDCGVCQEPQKGAVCHQMSRCGHVFCKKCITDCYSHYIKEGNVDLVQCMAFKCVISTKEGKTIKPTIAPAELLQVPLEKSLVQRYAELKRKKQIELDKTIVYCPRPWCQAPARSEKYPQLADLSLMTEADDSPTTDEQPVAQNKTDMGLADASKHENDDRLRQCEKCSFAFCRVCKATWHGEYFRCRSRDTAEISKEEQATLAFIRRNTSECPTCLVPVQKSMGCNHMTCGQCRTHFCYLCAQWLDPTNPYIHFNVEGRPCYQHLWDNDEVGHVEFFGARAAEMQAAAFEEELDDH